MEDPDLAGRAFAKLVLEEAPNIVAPIDTFVREVFGSCAEWMEERITEQALAEALDRHAAELFARLGSDPQVERFVAAIFAEATTASTGQITAANLHMRLATLKADLRRALSP